MISPYRQLENIHVIKPSWWRRLTHRFVHRIGIAAGQVEHFTEDGHEYYSHVCATCGKRAKPYSHSHACSCVPADRFPPGPGTVRA